MPQISPPIPARKAEIVPGPGHTSSPNGMPANVRVHQLQQELAQIGEQEVHAIAASLAAVAKRCEDLEDLKGVLPPLTYDTLRQMGAAIRAGLERIDQ